MDHAGKGPDVARIGGYAGQVSLLVDDRWYR